MHQKPIVLEVCGIPYSRKTSVIMSLQGHLRKHSVKFEVIDEFNGEGSFYESAKHTPDFNIVRATRCLERIITSKHARHNSVILVDRGIFDTYCWMKWFEKRGRSVKSQKIFAQKLIDLMQEYTHAYIVIQMNIDPLFSVANHGHQGSIVNTSTVTQLSNCYEEAISEYQKKIKIDVVDGSSAESEVHAKNIFKKHKLGKILI